MNRLVQGSSLGRAKHMDVSAAPQMTAGDFTDNSVSPTIVNVFNSSQSDAFFPTYIFPFISERKFPIIFLLLWCRSQC